MTARGTTADLATIGGRLKAERVRLNMSQAVFAGHAGVKKLTQITWEAEAAYPNAEALAAFAKAGADVLFIITGRREATAPTMPQALADFIVRQAMATLTPADRHGLLLDLLAEELRP